MIPSRKVIFSALFALLNSKSMRVANGGLFNIITDRPRLWSEYNSADFPVLGLLETEEIYEYRAGKGSPANRTLKADVFIYTDVASDPNVNPAQQLDDLIDAVENILIPAPNPSGNQIQQLGNLVANCWISDAPKKAPGYTDTNGIAIIPISILVP